MVKRNSNDYFKNILIIYFDIYRWWVGLWSDCICAEGTSVKFRSVLCLRSRDQDNTRSEVVRESECTGKKPPSYKFCNETETIIECKKRSALVAEKPQTFIDLFRNYEG